MRKQLVLGLLLVVGACQGSTLRKGGTDGGLDTKLASGGISATGGISTTGGIPLTGGIVTTGGIPGSGGLPRTGGIPLSGGVPASGGAVASPDAKPDRDGDSGFETASAVDQTVADTAINGCENPLPLRCGDRLNHSTVVNGRPDTWRAYACTAQLMSGRETLYAFQSPGLCRVDLRFKPTVADLQLLQLQRCDLASCTSIPTMAPLFTAQAGQSRYFVVDGYAGAEGGYTLEVDCECDLDGGAVDAPALDAPKDTGTALACTSSTATTVLPPLGIGIAGVTKVLNATLPANLASDANWGLKATVCNQAGYDLAPAAGKSVCLISQDITQRCQDSPATAWVVLNDGVVACVYKTVREGYGPTPGVYSATNPLCALPTVAPGASVSCGGKTCTSDEGPCCPTTLIMSRGPMCSPTCPVAMACDGPDDCGPGQECCSLETAAGFAGTACVDSTNCLEPSRVICGQTSDCPASQACGPADPKPTYVSTGTPTTLLPWDVNYKVCIP